MKRLLSALLLLIAALTARASAPELQLDPAVRHGQLPCGLTYYIMYSPRPAYKANFYLITRVGSTSEEENERGLAHFLEHCAFNGSEHFPGKGIQATMERHGLKFGYDINASTAFDATIFNISNVDMTADPGAMLDTCLLALRDIACGLTLADEAIEAERPIILEEWREGADAFDRYTQAALPVIFGPDCRYGSRQPIGTPQVLRGFRPQALRDFYRRWYQPQHQAVVVVGYVIPDEVEDTLARIWADVPAPAQPSVREWEQIPDHAGVRAGAFADPEFPGCQMDFWWLLPTPPRGERATLSYYKDCLVATLAQLAIDSRAKDVMHEPDAPWTGAAAEIDQYYYADSRDGLRLFALYDRSRRDEALRRVIALAKTAAALGLTAAELDAARAQMRSFVDVLPQAKSERNNDEIFSELSRAFTNDIVMLDPYAEQDVYRAVLDSITAADVDVFLRTTLRPANLAVMLAEKGTGTVEAASLAAYIERLWAETPVDSTAAVTDVLSRPILPAEPEPGRLVSAKDEKLFGAKIYTFAGGIRAIVCPARVLSNQVDFVAVRPGGLAAVADSGYAEAYLADEMANISGMGAFSANDLRKRLAPTAVELTASFSTHTDAILGTCRMDEIPTLLQLARLRLTEPRADTVAFANWKKATIGAIADSRGTPEGAFADSLAIAYYGPSHPLARKLTEQDIDTLSYPRAMRLFRQRTAHPAEYTYILTGDFMPDSILPLVARYIGSLQTSAAPRTSDDAVYRLRALPGVRHLDFTFPMADDKAKAHLGYELRRPVTVADDMTLQTLRLILETQLIAALRTEQGATYGADVDAYVSEEDSTLSLTIDFHTNASALSPALDTVRRQLAHIASAGPDPQLFRQAHDYLAEQYYVATLQQRYPLEYYIRYALTGRRSVADRAPAIAAVTPRDVARLAARILEADTRVTVTMRPQ